MCCLYNNKYDFCQNNFKIISRLAERKTKSMFHVYEIDRRKKEGLMTFQHAQIVNFIGDTQLGGIVCSFILRADEY